MTKTSELYLKLQEAANTGEWLESRLHLMFTDTISDATTGEIRATRSPIDFIFPGQSGFDNYVPLFGCGG